MSINAVTHIVGRAGRDAERVAGTNRVKFTVAVESGYDTDKKENITEWVDITAWDALADVAEKNVKKGMRLWVAGKSSVYTGSPSGPRTQIAARDIGAVDRYFVDTPKAIPGGSPVDGGDW